MLLNFTVLRIICYKFLIHNIQKLSAIFTYFMRNLSFIVPFTFLRIKRRSTRIVSFLLLLLLFVVQGTFIFLRVISPPMFKLYWWRMYFILLQGRNISRNDYLSLFLGQHWEESAFIGYTPWKNR